MEDPTMLSPEQIHSLESFDGNGDRILSAYLDLDPARKFHREYRVSFDDYLKRAREALEEPGREDLSREAARAKEWLESEEPRGKGLVLFSCSKRGLWQAYFLPVRVENH